MHPVSLVLYSLQIENHNQFSNDFGFKKGTEFLDKKIYGKLNMLLKHDKNMKKREE